MIVQPVLKNLTMKLFRKSRLTKRPAIFPALALMFATLFAAPVLHAQTDDAVAQLKAMVEDLKKTIEAQNARIAELEKNKAVQSAPAPVSPPPPPSAARTATDRLEAASPSIQTV